MERSRTVPEVGVEVSVHGEVSPDCVEHARAMVRKVVGPVRQPVLRARVRLSQGRDPAVRRSAVAQANLSINGRPVRAHVAAGAMHEAIDLLEDRLSERVARLARHGDVSRKVAHGVVAHLWHHGDGHHRVQDPRTEAAENRRVVRHKSFSLARETPEEAAFEMETLDYGFHLFTDIRSGQDAVVYRAEPAGYRLACLRPGPEAAELLPAQVTMSPVPAPRLDLSEAEEHLELTGYPFVFFADRQDGRGNVLYRRVDGHYGLITPAA